MSTVSVHNLTMVYRAPVRMAGLGAAVRSLFKPQFRDIPAVSNLSFTIEAGEVVGFIGPNGAGKTTTLKILSGILHPTSGQAQVLGHEPWQRARGFLRQIGMIRGSRPIGGPGELTVLDALRFQQLIYEVAEAEFKRNLAELTELLALESLLQRQVRALSLGERMRAGLALALVYRPKVLFLDEPTIGLDVTAVGLMRQFIADYSRQTGATILLTSHYMADVERLCRRIMLIDQGQLRYDGDLETLSAQLSPYKLLKVAVAQEAQPVWADFGEVVESTGSKVSLQVHRHHVPAVAARLLAELPVADLSVEETPLENVIDRFYREGVR